MAKSKKKLKNTAPIKTQPKATFSLTERNQDILFLVVITSLLVFMLKPFVIDGLSPQGVDVIGSLGKMHQLGEYKQDSGEIALWNPTIFAGMPVYHRLRPVAFSVDTLLNFFSRFSHPAFIYYLFGALGFYILLRYLKFTPLISFVSTLLFILFPHYKSLILEGHFAKFSALMILPWIALTFKYFLKSRNILSAALFALAFGIQIRTQHYQIVFYSGLFVFALGVYPFIRDLLDKEYTKFAKSTGLLLAALVLSILMAAQPLFLAKEYLPYSKRGKTTIDVNNPAANAGVDKADGVSMQYATQWSTHPSELFTWIIPRFYGGMSGEKYTGSAQPRLKGQMIPGYWGYMPFTQSYEYMGAITLLLAIVGLIYNRKKLLIKSLGFFALFLVILSFGRHFDTFYGLFFDYVPFFNKFRTPMMTVTLTFFIVAVFSAYGLQTLSSLKREDFDFKKEKKLIYSVGAFVIIGVLIWLVGQGFSFTKPSGEPYQAQTLDLIKSIRMEYFNQDVLRYLALVIIAGGFIIGYLKQKVNFVILALIIMFVSVVDFLNIHGRSDKKFVNVKRLEAQYFKKTSTDEFLLKDNDLFRIFPSGKLFGDNRWAYFHQTIGGYTPIKMYTIEELVEKNIYNGWDQSLPFNWNVLKLLNVKYLILEGNAQHPNLQLVNADQGSNWFTFRLNDNLPRGFFVGQHRIIEDEYDRIRTINSREFDPAQIAILEEQISKPIQAPDSSFVKVVRHDPNQLEMEVYTDTQALLVISEVYYPPGWKILIDGQPIQKIYKTNHAIQSVVVPQGNHKIEAVFEPNSYYDNIRLAYTSVGILYLSIIISLYPAVRRKISK